MGTPPRISCAKSTPFMLPGIMMSESTMSIARLSASGTQRGFGARHACRVIPQLIDHFDGERRHLIVVLHQ